MILDHVTWKLKQNKTRNRLILQVSKQKNKNKNIIIFTIDYCKIMY